jgi:hypothetical protein
MGIWLFGVLLLSGGIAIVGFAWRKLDEIARVAAAGGMLAGACMLLFGLLGP